MITAALLVGSYILGSIPFGLLIVKAWCGVDIREHGSGNIGATNVWRTAGKVPAVIVFIADVMKGCVPVYVCRNVVPQGEWISVAAGLVALLGHTASIFLRFKGGKGVATGLGIFIAINPVVAFTGLGVWGLFLALTRYVSLSSVAGAATIPIYLFIQNAPTPHKALAVFAASYVLIKHRSNMVRLVQGTEPRIGSKKKSPEGGSADGS